MCRSMGSLTTTSIHTLPLKTLISANGIHTTKMSRLQAESWFRPSAIRLAEATAILILSIPDTINSIQADITVESISELDGIPYAQLKGIWYNDGKTEIAGAITVKGNRVYYSVYDDGKMNSQRTYSWDADELARGDLLTAISPGQTVTAKISLSGRTLSFSVNGQPPVEYTIQGDMFPPVRRLQTAAGED